jgi:NADH:ubiquinone oxidoreductase subunit
MKGELVGTDDFGNCYYRERGNAAKPRRWVVFKGEVEASKVPADWHRWLHHGTATPPSEETATPKPWQKEHLPNLTGTSHAYRPPGDVAGDEPARGVPESYEPWRP